MMPKYWLEMPCATEACGDVVVHVPVTDEGVSGSVTAARSGCVVLELLLPPWTAVLVMEDVTANAIKNERALEKESMMSCGGRGRFCVLEEEKAVLYFVEEEFIYIRRLELSFSLRLQIGEHIY